MSDIGSKNNVWVKEIIDQLLIQGIDYFCISPGSRSTPLALALSQNKAANKHIHFDERSLGFHALGYAKGAKKPAVVIVTSGTAVANLFPSVMEASLAQVPMIVFTADRPPELRDCGSNQTADQVKLFGNFVRWHVDLPCPDNELPCGYLGSTIAQAVFCSQNPLKGPVHINCMFREPLFGSDVPSAIYHSTHYEPMQTTLNHERFEEWAKTLSQFEKGVIIVGANSCKNDLDPIFALSEKLRWPLFGDIISGAREISFLKNGISYSDAILKTFPDIRADAVLHFGDRLVSKTLLDWLDKSPPKLYCQIADHPLRHDPKHILTHRIVCDPVHFCKSIQKDVRQRPISTWLQDFNTYSQAIDEHISAFFQDKELSEPFLFYKLSSLLPSDWGLFLSNSMPIRDADQWHFSKEKMGPIFSNRGVSGIDGNIATAIGIAQGLRKPVLAILGDLASLHDINSLAQLKKSKQCVIILVINNGGGGIFSFLPIKEKKEAFEEYFAIGHEWKFEHAAKLFDLPYYHPSDMEEWGEILEEAIDNQVSCLIEVTTNREENLKIHQELSASIKDCLCSLIAPVEA